MSSIRLTFVIILFGISKSWLMLWLMMRTVPVLFSSLFFFKREIDTGSWLVRSNPLIDLILPNHGEKVVLEQTLGTPLGGSYSSSYSYCSRTENTETILLHNFHPKISFHFRGRSFFSRVWVEIRWKVRESTVLGSSGENTTKPTDFSKFKERIRERWRVQPLWDLIQ